MRILVCVVLLLSVTGCSNFIDGMAGLSSLSYDANGNAYVPRYPDDHQRRELGGGNCTGYALVGRVNNNTYARLFNNSSRPFRYTMYWADGVTASGALSPGGSTQEIYKIMPTNQLVRTTIECFDG
jgi:hypothetical protein